MLDADFIGSAWNRSGSISPPMRGSCRRCRDDRRLRARDARRAGRGGLLGTRASRPSRTGTRPRPAGPDRGASRPALGRGSRCEVPPVGQRRGSRRGGDAPGAKASTRPSLLAHGHRPRGTDCRSHTRGDEIAGVDPHGTFRRCMRCSSRRSPTTGDTTRSRSTSGPTTMRAAQLRPDDVAFGEGRSGAGCCVGGTGLWRSRLDQRDRGPEVSSRTWDRRRPAASFVLDVGRAQVGA